MAVSSYLSSAPPRVLAHRGLAVDQVENTAEAFAAASAVGAEYIETDVHASADGVAVLWHDPDLRRFGGNPARIDQLTWSELAEFEHRGARLQRLSDALAQFPQLKFNIDLKTEAALEPTIAEVRLAAARDRVLLTSFDDARRRRAAALLPGVATSAGGAAIARIIFSQLWLGHGARWQAVCADALAGAVALQIPRRQHGVPVLSRALIDTAHALGAEVHVWTINSPAEMQELWALGVDGIVTDRCDLALPLLGN